jgi:monoamine oxidase
MHAIEFYIPKPYTAIFKDWRDDPFGGGWHFWNPRTKPWKIMQEMRRPKPDRHVYVCGEAYSGNQGWVEGALTSAEIMLEESFGLPRPAWLPDDYFLGTQLECPP